MDTILLKGGTVLLHDEQDNVRPLQRDILVRGSKIIRIEQDIKGEEEVEVINCTNKIVSPGFVDTHRHMWETALKGVAEDETAANYFATSKTNHECTTVLSRHANQYQCSPPVLHSRLATSSGAISPAALKPSMPGQLPR